MSTEKTKKRKAESSEMWRVELFLTGDEFTCQGQPRATRAEAEQDLKNVEQERFEEFEKSWKLVRSHVRGCQVKLNQTWLDFIQDEKTSTFDTQFVDSLYDRDYVQARKGLDAKRLNKYSLGKSILVPLASVQEFLKIHPITGEVESDEGNWKRTDFVPYQFQWKTKGRRWTKTYVEEYNLRIQPLHDESFHHYVRVWSNALVRMVLDPKPDDPESVRTAWELVLASYDEFDCAPETISVEEIDSQSTYRSLIDQL